MYFNLYLDDQTTKESDQTAEELGESRSGWICKALREWLDKRTLGSLGWPSLILEWQGVPDMPPFESYRGELRPLCEHAFLWSTSSIRMCSAISCAANRP